MNNALCCTNCGDVVVKSVHGGSLKIRAKVLVFKGSQAIAVCKGCDTEIPVPIRFDESMMKAVTVTKKLRLYVNA